MAQAVDEKNRTASTVKAGELNYVCGTDSFMRWTKQAVVEARQKRPTILSERVRVEEFTY